MIRPTPRAVLLFSLGIPVAMLMLVWNPALWPFSFDLKTRTAISQKHEAGCACHELRSCTSNDLAGPGPQLTADEFIQSLCSPDNRIEARRAEHVIAHAMSSR